MSLFPLNAWLVTHSPREVMTPGVFCAFPTQTCTLFGSIDTIYMPFISSSCFVTLAIIPSTTE